MKGVNFGGADDKIVALSPADLPASCQGCDVSFADSDPGIFLDGKLAYRIHDRAECITKFREKMK